MSIKPSTIEKHLSVFNEIKAICDNRNVLHLEQITNNHKVSTSAFYSSVKLNYFKKVDLEKYECLVGKFERLHIRKILEYTNDRYKNGHKALNIENNPALFETELPKESEQKPAMIIPPTFEMVEKYCNERKNDINPAKFMAYYEQKGWRIGKEKMKNWKMAVHTWEQKNYTIANKKLSDYTDQELIDELKRRGYTGLLELNVKREISF